MVTVKDGQGHEAGPGVLDGAAGCLAIDWDPRFVEPTTCVTLLAKPARVGEWLAVCRAPDPKDSWVLSIFDGGDFCVYWPGLERRKFWASLNVADGQWHELAVTLDRENPSIRIDGRPQTVKKQQMTVSLTLPHPAGVTVGTRVESAYRGSAEALVRGIRFDRSVLDTDSPAHAIASYVIADARPDGAVASTVAGAPAARIISAPSLRGVSLDELDRRTYAAGPGPCDGTVVEQAIVLRDSPPALAWTHLSLDGTWQLSEHEDGRDAVPAVVPGSVHAALVAGGRIPDPTVGRQSESARQQSTKTWWYRRRFDRPAGAAHRLCFDGVANRCTVWLNGHDLGTHEGMFGGPTLDVTGLLTDDNELLVHIDPVPTAPGFMGGDTQDNGGWRDTVTFNNAYGWHYCDVPPLGIWRSVRVETAAETELAPPFVMTENAAAGRVRVAVEWTGTAAVRGRLDAWVSPENFDGPTNGFTRQVVEDESNHRLILGLTLPDPRPWWPNGYGEQNLYRLTLRFTADNGVTHEQATTFGLRTIGMAPVAGVAKPSRYDWTFVVNDRPIFMKGTGWCTLDPLLDFRRQRYERFLTLAKQQHCTMVRAWGSGMPETNDFYDLCDRLGLLVMQEWPTAWNSHWQQPREALDETVRLNTIRLRNHPSLTMWAGGNESSEPFGDAIDYMARCAIELDGTRPFHRGEPWGGSTHDYKCWWENAPLDWNVNLTGTFFGEFGLASVPVEESVRRYLPDEEQHVWPPAQTSAFAYHTPVFNTKQDLDRLWQYAGYFSAGATRQRFIVASQLSQAVGVRHTLERARTRWPDCTGALMYKLNDNFPAASWSTVDWYGAPKLSHWVVQDAFAPLAAAVVFDTLNVAGKPLSVPVFLLDDVGVAARETLAVCVVAFDDRLREVGRVSFAVPESTPNVAGLGTFDLPADATASTPLIVVAEVRAGDVLWHRTFYVLNFERKPDCLFELPTTTLAVTPEVDGVTLTNAGTVPAVGASVQRPGHADTFDADENVVWLNPGESVRIRTNAVEGLVADAWNLAGKAW